MTTRIARTALLLAALSVPAFASSHERGPVRVAYVTETTAYLDAGRSSGLAEGDRYEIERGGRVVAVLEVRYLSSGKAACELREVVEWPEPGDRATFVVEGAVSAVEPPSPPRSTPRRGFSLRDLGFKGRVGLRYSAIDDRSGTGEDYSQPSLTFRAEGDRIAGGPWGFFADVRARRTYRHRSDGSHPESSRNRVYRAEISWHPDGSPWRLAVGRQASPDFAAVSLFDGILLKRGAGAWSAGLFAGTQPDPADHGWSEEIFESGGFAKYEGRGESVRWSVTSGLVGSYEEGEPNREYLFARALYDDRRTYGTMTQEADINRGWKADAGEPGLSPTSTYAFLRHRVFGGTSLEGGFDNRRRVRLYRDRVTPESDFDDSYRQGTWIGATQKLGGEASLSARLRNRSGEIRSWTVNGRTRIPPLANLRLRGRSTRFENGYAEGWFHSISAGVPVGDRARIEVTRGLRREEEKSEGTEGGENLHWTSIDLDLTLARRWHLSLSGEIDKGDGEDHRSIYSSTSYRF